MKLLIKIGYMEFVSPRQLTPLEVGSFLSVMADMKEVNTEYTPGNRIKRSVISSKNREIGVDFVEDDEFCTAEEFKALVAANPEPKEEGSGELETI